MDPHITYCMMIWDTVKSAHGGFPRSLLLCTSDSAWRLRPSSLDGMKIRVSWKELSPATRHGCITMIRRAKDKAWNGGIPLLQRRRNSRQPSAKKKNLVNALLGHAWTYSGAFTTAWANSEQCSLLCNVAK